MPSTIDPQANKNNWPLDQWEYLYGQPLAGGTIRTQPEDFLVEELLGFEPAGVGAHLWINISKKLLNTPDVAKKLSDCTDTQLKNIGYSGLKDRNAVTSQWFSLPTDNNQENKQQAIATLCEQEELLTLNQISTNPKKLKRGVHRKNRFSITIRDLSTASIDLELRLKEIRDHGVPNYFGNQRFGRNGKNLQTAAKLFTNKNMRIDRMARSMALSSARSWIFNEMLSARIAKGTWNQPSDGDMMQLNGTNVVFLHDGSDSTIIDRIAAHDIHLTGPLWGQGPLQTDGDIAEFEHHVRQNIPVFPEGLEAMGLKQQRRALRLIPENFEWVHLSDHTIRLTFDLPRGSFATAVFRELVLTDQ